MSGSDWGIQTVEHTFSTGRTATLRKSFPLTALIEQGVVDKDVVDTLIKIGTGDVREIADAEKLLRAVCVGMFVAPAIITNKRQKPKQDKDGNWLCVPFESLDQEEVVETFVEAAASIVKVSRFLRQLVGAAIGQGGDGVANAAKSARGTRARKPRSASPRRVPSKTPAGGSTL